MIGLTMHRQLIGLLILGLMAVPAQAQRLGGAISLKREEPKPTVQAVLSTKELQPGQQAAVAVVLEIPAGLHSQSHTPLSKYLIPLEVKVEENPAVKLYQPVYPAGQIEEYPALGKISVYTGRVVVYVPVEVKADAAMGPVKLAGTVEYQLCDDKQCLPPDSVGFAVESTLVGAGQAVTANQAELFSGFDASVFSQGGKAASAPVAESLFGPLGEGSYLLAFLSAFVVGIIFNVMPCVLPVVPLKAMGFYEVSQHNRAKSLLLGIVFSAGLVASFGVLALLVVVLKVVAWGEIFGQAWFAAIIVAVLVLMAAGTFGAFSVGLPTAVYRWTPRHDTMAGNFLFGILTAVLSTPCTFGMFLGLLLWATTQPAAVGVALLMTVGAGMAFPYLVLSATPELARRFPRTGPWAQIVKQMMGFLLLATAVYFARRFTHGVVSDAAMWWLLFGVLSGAGVFLVVRTVQFTARPAAIASAAVVAALIIGPALWATLRLTYVPIDWQPYTAEALAAARAANRPVLVKFTATWCGNCQALEATVFTDKQIVEAVRAKDVVMLKADVTDSHAAGWALLKQVNPAGGIPYTLIYPPHQPTPTRLGGLYSTGDLLGALGTGEGVEVARP